MATPSAALMSRERLQPSLLDRLSDDRPGDLHESAEQRSLSLNQLKDSVLRDLGWLLNSTCLLDSDASQNTPAGSSVINFGLPALAGNCVSNVDVEALERIIRQAIIRFEPRILAASVRVKACMKPDEMNHNGLSFAIEGDLWAQPVPLRLLLQTDLDLESGNVRVAQAERRRT